VTREELEMERLALRIADEAPSGEGSSHDSQTAVLTTDPAIEAMRELERVAHAFRRVRSNSRDSIAQSTVAQGAPAEFAHLKIMEKLGEGGQGEVYRAYDPLLDQHVALKLRKMDSGIFANKFLDEGRRLAKLRHPNILSVYGAAIHEGRAGIWTELIDGCDLAKELKQKGSFPIEEVRAIGIELCRALAVVHRQGMAHGDIKAENVLLTQGGRAVLSDFGVASDIGAAPSPFISGTLPYLAPERLLGNVATPTSDIYALGVLLFVLLTGRFPYDGRDAEELQRHQKANKFLSLKKLRPEVPDALVHAIEKALAAEPEQRPASGFVFAGLLQTEEKVIASPSIWLNRWAIGLSSLALVSLVGLTSWIGFRQSTSTAITSWTATAQFLKTSPDGTSMPLENGGAVQVGDRLSLKLNSDRQMYLYVFNDDGTGNASVLFPLVDVTPVNPLAASTDIQLPGRMQGQEMSWQITSDSAKEEFLVLASSQPQPKLEQMITDWQRPTVNTPKTRGIAALTPLPPQDSITSEALRAVIREAQSSTDNGEIQTWHYQFVHR